jgi:hypothetical protein
MIEIRNFFKNNSIFKLSDMFKYGDYYWLYHPWQDLKKHERKLAIHLEDSLEVFLPKNYMSLYHRPIDLIESVGYVNTVIRLKPSDDNLWELRNNKNPYRKSLSPHEYLYNFIMNNIASMIYMNKN